MFVHRKMLTDMGYMLDIAKNGKKALDKSINNYDLIFMDIGLPDINGIEVTAEIRRCKKEENKKRSCIIALTAYSVEEIGDKCFAVGMDNLASKPIDEDELQKLITKYCG